MPLYITTDDVEVRLQGKVRFTDDLEDENKMSRKLLKVLIDEAEADVEQDLSQRYETPFKAQADTAFKTLPDRPTKLFIQTLCRLKATLKVLETDFGRGSVVNGDAYAEKLKIRYEEMVQKMMARKESGAGWKFPPLPELKFAWHNTEADDGYVGMLIHSTRGDGGYPGAQINDPSENYWSGEVDDLP